MKWSIGKIASKRALFSPQKSAIIYEDRPINYKRLNEDVNRLANFLRAKGLRKGDRISVCLYNCPEFLVSFLAAAKLGLIIVPLHFRLVGRELEYQLNRSGTRLFIFDHQLTEIVAKIRSSIRVDDDKFICLTNNSDKVDANCPDWALPYSEIVRNASAAEPEPEELIDLDDPLMILYTSGVAGNPKGAIISHGQTFFKIFQIMIYTDMREDDVVLFQAPLCHSAGLAIATPALCRGASLIMRKKFDASQFATDIEKFKATIVFGLTTMFRFILESEILDKVDTSSVRITFGGGERTPPGLIQNLAEKGIHLLMGYGQTENSAMILMPRDIGEEKIGSCGLPNFFTDAWIEGIDGARLPPGQVGEIVARGPNVISGYWDMPEETAKTIVDGKLYTGDLGYTDDDGFFYIVDRAKDMYRSGGENVYPAEVEKILAQHPKIENVAIIGVPDEKWGETGKAFIKCKKGSTTTKDEVIQFLDGKVARYKFPGQVEVVDSMPMTSWGKVKKSVLKNSHSALRTSEKFGDAHR
jgi:fatty-acyl-CoA synthase